jgi:DNA-binding PadR family transcriptional regulator
MSRFPSIHVKKALDIDPDYNHNVVIIMLGEFEYLMLTAAARLGEDAYGVAIRQHIAEATGRCCSIGALYTTLDRLEAKGYIKTWMGDPTPQRGGRPKRRVRVTAKGVRAASDFYGAVSRVSRGAAWETKPNQEGSLCAILQ